MKKINFRNKYLRITIRIITGLMFLGSGISGLYSGTHNMLGVPPEMIPSSTALWSYGIFEMIKITEIVAGLMLAAGFLPWLGALAVVPICVGIIVFDLNVAPQYIASGIVVSILVGYLGYVYWDKYKQLFMR